MLSAQIEKYERAIQVFEEVWFNCLHAVAHTPQCAAEMVENPLLKWGAKEWFMKAGLCRLCMGDFIGAKVTIQL